MLNILPRVNTTTFTFKSLRGDALSIDSYFLIDQPDRNRHQGHNMSKMAEDSSLKALNMVEDKRTPIHRLGLPAETLQKVRNATLDSRDC